MIAAARAALAFPVDDIYDSATSVIVNEAARMLSNGELQSKRMINLRHLDHGAWWQEVHDLPDSLPPALNLDFVL